VKVLNRITLIPFVFFTRSLRRSGGQTGLSQIAWNIKSLPSQSITIVQETFESSKGIVVFADGEKQKEIQLQVRVLLSAQK